MAREIEEFGMMRGKEIERRGKREEEKGIDGKRMGKRQGEMASGKEI